MRNVLLTGATGFLGRYIQDSLEARHHQVTTLGRHPVDGQSFIQNDLGDSDDALLLNEQYDLVVHAAGKAHIAPRSNEEKQAFWDLNYQGTKKLLDSLETNNVLPTTYVFISTVSVYGLDAGEAINEATALNARDPYGASKKKGEEYVKWWGAKNQVNWFILRLPLIAGKNPPGNLGSIIQAIQQGKYFGIGKGEARKSMVMADDVANLIPELQGQTGIYHLTDGHHPSFRELETKIQEIIGKKIPFNIPCPVAWLMASAGDLAQFLTCKRMPFNSDVLKKMTQSLTFDDAKAREELGWKPSKVLDRMEEVIQ